MQKTVTLSDVCNTGHPFLLQIRIFTGNAARLKSELLCGLHHIIQSGTLCVSAAQSPYINHAGITKDTLLMAMKQEQWDAIINTNLTSIYRMSKAVIRGMMKKRNGRIVNISSVVGASGNAGQTNYAAAKAGLVARCWMNRQRTFLNQRPKTSIQHLFAIGTTVC